MSLNTDTPVDVGAASVENLRTQVQALQREISDLWGAIDSDGRKSMTIIATRGTLDMTYPPLILISTAAAFDQDVVVFHTFWGLDILHEKKSRNLKLSAIDNPSMPMPNAVAALPFMGSAAASMMEKRIQKDGAATVEELVKTSLDMDVGLQACQMTIELMGYGEAEFYGDVTTDVDAATALQHMTDADMQLMTQAGPSSPTANQSSSSSPHPTRLTNPIPPRRFPFPFLQTRRK